MNLNIFSFFKKLTKNIITKKNLLFSIPLIIGISFLPSLVNAEVIISHSSERNCVFINNECVYENKRGGSDPLVVEKLRQETYKNREYAKTLSLLEAERKKNEEKTEKSIISPSPFPTIMPYPENFKTIGDVSKEKEEKNKRISIEKLSDEISILQTEKEKNNCSSQFSDITGNKNKENIEILECMNILSGRENGKFFPDEAITRKEAIKISLLVSGKKIITTKKSSVADIDDNDWSVPYVETARKKKYIYINKEKKLEGDRAVQTDEAFALYLSLTKIGIEASKNTQEKITKEYEGFKKFIKPQKIITNYEIKNTVITRGEFTKLSLYILQILRREEDFEGPTEQLNGEKYSASQKEPVNPKNIFPEIFTK